jgi:predicted nucleic acid-binding protein
MAIGDHDGPELEELARKYTALGVELVSSQLLELECRRATIRLNLESKPYPEIEELVQRITLLPITDKVWSVAMSIPQHVKTLDALHLATCSLVPECLLLSSDANMRTVAPSLGIELA